MQKTIIITIVIIAFTLSGYCSVNPPIESPGFDTGGDNPLTTSFTWQGNGGVFVVPMAIDGLNDPSGTLVVDSIPDGSEVVYACFGTTGWHSSISSASLLFNGVPMGSIMPTVNDNGGSPTNYDLSFYRWDVTDILTENGSYYFSLTDINYCYIAYLAIIYENDSYPAIQVVLNDGSESLKNASSITNLSGFQPGYGVIRILSQAGDTDSELDEIIEFNGVVLAGPGAVFSSNIGDHADYHHFNLSNVQTINTLTTTTGPDWLGIHLAVLEAPTGPPPSVTVTLTPFNPPIIIPANGGSFSFNIETSNVGASVANYNVWTFATLPTGGEYGPIIGPVNLVLEPGGTIDRDRTQTVPSSAPSGVYTYDAYAGYYPGIIVDEDHFQFEKLAIDNGVGFTYGWKNIGESFNNESVAEIHRSSFIIHHSVHPNPFNQQTVVSYQLLALSHVNLAVYDIAGREVAKLVDGYQTAGHHEVVFDAGDLASGVYLVRLEAGKCLNVKKLLLVK